MARVDSRTLFLTTSPRTPAKMVPEIALLGAHFAGRPWDKETQTAFMDLLKERDFFNGRGENDPAFSARDRINRAPKALGFVTLRPTVQLTAAGEALTSGRRTDEVFLRQMLKFQLPSPYHRPSERAARFCVRPYLEMLRLVRRMGTLTFDELQIFGMQLTDWHQFEHIVRKIEHFRKEKAQRAGSYRTFKGQWLDRELRQIHATRIAQGATKTRESNDRSLEKFLKTQASNMRDYADACFRYLRATGLVAVSHVGKSLTIVPERVDEVDHILQHVERDPLFVDDEARYIAYLGDACTPQLLTDDREWLMQHIAAEAPSADVPPGANVAQLKDLLATHREEQKRAAIEQEVRDIKDRRLYDDIQQTYRQICEGALYDTPLMLEWNTWRAMTMLDGGEIKANLKFDDFGRPLSTAQGNMADIVCDYGDFMLTVEVTTASGQRQYEMEGEPVSRHLGRMKAETGKPCYTLFVAPTINEACVAHFYALHRMNISYYGGRSVIVPLPIVTFQKMLEDSHKASYTPNPAYVRRFFEHSKKVAETCADERQWFEQMQQAALRWLE